MRLGLSPDLSSLASLRFLSGGFGVSTASSWVSKMPARSRSQNVLHSQLGKGSCPIELAGVAGTFHSGSRGSSGCTVDSKDKVTFGVQGDQGQEEPCGELRQKESWHDVEDRT